MLSYQHMYHAGNLADVHKHAALSVLLTKLTQKEKPLTYIETHAGRGIYDLTSDAAQKTHEAQNGIEHLLKLKKIPAAHPYFQLLRRVREEVGNNVYPGSPFIAEALLRPTDTIHLMELHPQEYAKLRYFMNYPNVHIHKRDGYEGVLAITPPPVRRGVVLIDPSYEIKTEYALAAQKILKLAKKWHEAHIMVWYPLLEENRHHELLEPLKAAGLKDSFNQQVLFKNAVKGMIGSGVFIVNTPYGTQEELEKIAHFFG